MHPLPPCRLFRKSMSVVAQAILPVELIDTTLGSRCLLRAGIELVALGADFHVDLRRCGAGHERVAAVACDSCLIILGMDSLSHGFSSLPGRLIPPIIRFDPPWSRTTIPGQSFSDKHCRTVILGQTFSDSHSRPVILRQSFSDSSQPAPADALANSRGYSGRIVRMPDRACRFITQENLHVVSMLLRTVP